MLVTDFFSSEHGRNKAYEAAYSTAFITKAQECLTADRHRTLAKIDTALKTMLGWRPEVPVVPADAAQQLHDAAAVFRAARTAWDVNAREHMKV